MLDTDEKKMSYAYLFENLSVSYGKTEILKGITGCILKGHATALIGPNGSGKTTLLKALCSLLPFHGKLDLNGQDIKGYTRRELGKILGIVAQQTSMKNAFTVYETIGFGRIPHQGLLSPFSKLDEEITQEAAKRLGISHLLFRPVTELSGGEKARVMLAMAVAQEPEIFLLDEPTAAMDPYQARHAFRLMKELADSGKTVVTVAHDINAALTCADNYIALREGKILSVGTSSELDEDLLQELYGTPFERYTSEKGDKVWHPTR